MTNPFRLRWLQGWTFQVVLMEGHVQVEAVGFGICLRTAVLPGESPKRQLIVWFYLKIDAGVLYTMPGFAVRTWCSQPGFPPRKRTCRPPILLWLLARPIGNGWPDHLSVHRWANSQARAKPTPPKRSAFQKRSPEAGESVQPTGGWLIRLEASLRRCPHRRAATPDLTWA